MQDNQDKETSTDPWGAPSLLHNGYRISLPGVKRPGRVTNNPPPSSTKIKKSVELYL